MFEPVELDGVAVDDQADIFQCAFCDAPIWWGFTRHKRRNPFDVVGGRRTSVTHWSTCTQRDAAQAHFKQLARTRGAHAQPRAGQTAAG